MYVILSAQSWENERSVLVHRVCFWRWILLFWPVFTQISGRISSRTLWRGPAKVSRDTNGSRIVIQIGGGILLFSAKRRAYFCKSIPIEMRGGKSIPIEMRGASRQQILQPTPLNSTPTTCHKRIQKLRCNFRKVALQFSESCSVGRLFNQKLRWNKSKTTLQHWKSCVAGKWRFPVASLFRLHVWVPLTAILFKSIRARGRFQSPCLLTRQSHSPPPPPKFKGAGQLPAPYRRRELGNG